MSIISTTIIIIEISSQAIRRNTDIEGLIFYEEIKKTYNVCR